MDIDLGIIRVIAGVSFAVVTTGSILFLIDRPAWDWRDRLMGALATLWTVWAVWMLYTGVNQLQENPLPAVVENGQIEAALTIPIITLYGFWVWGRWRWED